MIVRAAQMKVFQQYAEAQFVEEVHRGLAERYRHILPRFPEPIQHKIVGNLLTRAKRWGISWKSSLSCFAELMLAIAPNFDEQPEIRAVLDAGRSDVDRVVLSLTDRVPDEAWEGAESRGHDLPLFVASQNDVALSERELSSALPLVLWTDAAFPLPPDLARSSLQLSETLRLKDVPDAALTLAVWRGLYGEDFRDASKYPWLSDVFHANVGARQAVAMLKFRIALDFGRFV